MPNLQPALRLVGLRNSLLDDRERFQQYTDLLEHGGDVDDELGVVYVVFSEISMKQIDAALIVDVVGCHVIRTDEIVNTVSGAANGGHDVVSGLEFRHVGTDCLDTTKAFMSGYEKVITCGRGAIFGGINLFVSAIDTDAEHLDEHPSTIWDGLDGRLLQLREMRTVGFARIDRDSRHHLGWRFGLVCVVHS